MRLQLQEAFPESSTTAQPLPPLLPIALLWKSSGVLSAIGGRDSLAVMPSCNTCLWWRSRSALTDC